MTLALSDDSDRLVTAGARVWMEGGCGDAVAMDSVGEPELVCMTEGASVAHV